MPHQIITIYRGLPGSGKSSFCKRVHASLKGVVVCSADDFFTDEAGVYNFRPENIGLAHAACLRKFMRAIADGASLIAVDNTNTTVAEIAPYYALAQAYAPNAEIEIVTMEVSVETAIKRNIHGVSEDTIRQMWVRLAEEQARFPPWWNHQEVPGE